MEKNCIQDAKLEETGFSYTMSLIQGKYKMFILYALMDFGVVRFNELKKYIRTISYKTLSATLKELEAVLGKETIDTYNTGESRGRETSHSLNYQKLGKELMSQDELAVMDGGKCILQLRGVRPFLSDKYDITKHPNYPYTADADPKNAFDIEAFLSTRLKLKPNEVYDVYEVDAEGV